MPIDNQQQQRLRGEGISLVHADSFLAVAAAQDCVILTRSPGAACLDLLAEGHDAKGFHIKGKSCDWGPMAGFLCAEPLFNKAGGRGAVGNAAAHTKSLTKGFEKVEGRDTYSGLIALELSDARARAVAGGPIVGASHRGETRVPNSGHTLKWLLLQDPASKRWRVYHETAGLAAATSAAGQPADAAALAEYRKLLDARALPEPKDHPGYRPLLVLTNPHRPYSRPEELHKNAVTGDFDLFAVWPRRGRDAEFRVRVGGMRADANAGAIIAAEEADAIGKVVGNISDGLYLIGGLLNAEMAARTGQARVNRIFHSDEGGRPGMDEVDSSVAFTPDGRVLIFDRDLPAFAGFAHACATAAPTPFVVFLNAGWLAPLRAAAPEVMARLEPLVAWSEALRPRP
ncbi:MAG: hypothetical protein JNL82_37545 [Myxococcales bacterium]|nr:hypothetical protein [Myxococcales bacterium]